jgi:hypothetical protein
MDYRQTIEHIRKTRNTERMKNTFLYNEEVRKAWTPIWSRNAARSYGEVERRFVRQDCDMRNLPRINGEPVIIMGSGPSLDDVLPLLKDWKGKICCSTSHLPILGYMGIEPDYCFLIDADPTMEFLVKDYAKRNAKTIMICHPQLPREIIAAWPEDKVFFFRMYDPGDKFSQDYMPLIYGWMNQETNWHIGSYILNSGNVVNAMVPAMQALGAGTIFLCGYDLGYPDLPDKPGIPRHRSSYFGKVPLTLETLREGEEELLHPAPEMPTQQERPIVYERSNNGILCDELCFFYKYSFIILYGLGNVPVLSCSRGIVSEVPYVSPKEVVDKQGKGFEALIRKPEESYKIAQEYLKERGIYILKSDFHVETVNILTKKGLDKWLYPFKWKWYATKPWKWMGGKGYVPHKMKKIFKAQKEAAAKAGEPKCSTTVTY